MALVISDRVKETSVTNGTGAITLNGTYGGFQSFLSAIGDGNTTYYAIENDALWEVGIGTYTQSSNTLSRDTILKSSNDNDAISLVGVSRVFCTYPSDKAVYLDANNDITFSNTANFDKITADDITVTGLADLGNVNTSGTVIVSGDLLFYPTDQNDTFTMQRNAAGNFFHGYIDTIYDRTLALHTDGGVSPTWKLGLKTSPNSVTEAPDLAYIYGIDSDMGLVANSNNHITISNAGGFNVKHKNSTIIKSSTATGVHIDSVANAYPALTVNGGTSLSTNIQEWVTSAGSILSVVDKNGNFGIGKDNPSYVLDVDGSGSFEGLIANKAIKTQINSAADGSTITFDMNESNIHMVTLGGNRILAVSNADAGQEFKLRLKQDSTGSRTVTWFDTIYWAGGSVPTLTTTANKADLFGFICTSGGAYDGYIIGQNI